MEHGRTVNKIFEGKPEGTRRIEGPRLRWLEDIKNDLREIEVKRWRQTAANRAEWASVIKDAVSGPQSQGINK
jgi:hypothetical protein